MTAPAVALRSFTRSYASRVALDIDAVTLVPGTTAVLGPNGAGKSSLLRAVATVEAVSPGSVLVGGRDIADVQHRVEVRRRLGYVSQDDPLPERMRVDEFCDYVAALKEIGPRRRRRRWADWALSQVGLSDRAGERIGALSGGMRRRLSIAQSLLGHPTLLVLDEPLASLDASYRATIVRLIAASASQRSTIVATHHADELAAVCQQVLVLGGGRVLFAGRPDDLARKASGQVWESPTPIERPDVRALGPDRFRVVGDAPPGGVAVEPTVHDGYLVLTR